MAFLLIEKKRKASSYIVFHSYSFKSLKLILFCKSAKYAALSQKEPRINLHLIKPII